MMLKIKTIRYTTFILLTLAYALQPASAQTYISLKQAIDTSLRRNFDIQLVQNDLEIAKLNNTAGNAGALPVVTGNANNFISTESKDTRNSDGVETHTSATYGNTFGAGISAGITLFNGFRIAATKQRLALLQKQNEVALNRQIQSTIAEVSAAYYDIIRQERYLSILKNSLEVSKNKLEIVNAKKSAGMANGVETLMAQTDENSARQAIASQESQLGQAKNDFLTLINATLRPDIKVDTLIVPDTTLKLANTLNLLEQNNQLVAAGIQVQINEQRLKETAAQRYPSLKLTGGYSLLNNTYNQGSNRLNRTYGPEAGIGVQVPIYNGNIYRTEHKVADINLINSNLEKEQLRQNLVNTVQNLHTAYRAALDQLKLQEQNYALTSQLVAVVMERFRVNQATILEVKSAQASFDNAGYQLINMQYAAKIAETGIKQLTSSLTGQ